MLRTVFGVLLSLFIGSVHADEWLKLAPGVEYQDLHVGSLTYWSHVHAFKIDLERNELDLVMASGLAQAQASAHEFLNQSKALIAINGGFFDQNFQPLGLRISNQRQHNPLKSISWWGIFYTKNRLPHITSLHDFKQDTQIDFAVQAGPRLLIHGKIPQLKPGIAERSALGITASGQVIMIVTENSPMSTTWLAEKMKAPPLNCIDALNLDGGSSSQLYAHIESFTINVASIASVSDAIIVKPRPAT